MTNGQETTNSSTNNINTSSSIWTHGAIIIMLLIAIL